MNELRTISILVTGGAGFIGSNFVLSWMKASWLVRRESRSADLCGECRQPGVTGGRSALHVCARRYLRCGVGGIAAAQASAAGDCAFCGREPCGPLDCLAGGVYPDQCAGHILLLEQARAYWSGSGRGGSSGFRFLHVSTDEVYGTLGPDDPAFSETTAYAPNSPYAASKAGSDHLARAYFHTFGLPVLTTNCSNNYGPYQFPEKLIPLMILNALEGKPLPVYGDGKNVRDWLFVEDHCAAIRAVLESGRPGKPTTSAETASGRISTW